MNNPDWSMICLQLRSNYKNLDAIAKEVGSSWQHLNRLARCEVGEPKYSIGIKLLELHGEYCG